MNKRIIGGYKEDIATEYLIEHGYKIIDRNFSCKSGEIDIVAKDKEYLCFIEVKYRENNKYGDALEAINYKKQQKLFKCANIYIMANKLVENLNYRFDVVAIKGENIELINNAFGAM